MVERSDISIARVRRFINGGSADGFDPSVLADACNRLVRLEIQRSPKAAIGLARKFVKRASELGGILEQTALTVYGLALHASGRYPEARDALLEVRKLLVRVPDRRARVDRILIDVYMYLGNVKEATRRYRSSVGAFERLGDKIEAAKTRVNYANLLHRQDRHREAGRQYRLAINLLKATSDELSLAICRYNLANTLVQSIDFDGAAQLYLEAERALTRLGYDLYANECRYGLAWLRMLHGDYHLALTGLADCEVHYERAGQAKGVLLCQLDRAEIYLALNLLTDARNASRAAERRARRLGVRYEAAKAALFLAKASLAVGGRSDADRALSRAREGFKAEHNQAFLGVVELTSAPAQNGHAPRRAALDRARLRFHKAQLPLWEAISDLEHLALFPGDVDASRRLSRNRAVKVVPHLFARWQTLLGDRQHGMGRVAAARKHWVRAVEMLDNVRVQLPPAEVRSLLSRHGNDPYQRLVRSDCDRHPDEAAAWSERRRTGGPWAPLDVDTDDERARAKKSLSDLAQEFITLSAQIDPDTGRRSPAVVRRTRQLDDLQREVQRRLSRLELKSGGRTPSQQALLDEFRTVSMDRPVLQFHCDTDDVMVFAHSRGRTTSHRYAAGRRTLRQYADFWQFLVGRAVQSGGKPLRSDLDDERRLFTELGQWLCEPLEEFFAGDEVLILPEGELSNLPWQALILNGQSLAETTSVLLAPSLRHYLRARGIEVSSRKIVVFEGNTEGLSNCRDELAVFRTANGSDVTIHDACRRADWPDRTEGMIWHYLGHAQYRSDNPFYSSLQMADGPLFAADFRLGQNRVGLVTLAACRTGQQTFLPGEESIGLVRSLLEMGARNVIASHWAVADKSTALWMSTFYRSFLNNNSMAISIREAALTVRERFPSAYHWAAFSLFGAGQQ